MQNVYSANVAIIEQYLLLRIYKMRVCVWCVCVCVCACACVSVCVCVCVEGSSMQGEAIYHAVVSWLLDHSLFV